MKQGARSRESTEASKGGRKPSPKDAGGRGPRASNPLWSALSTRDGTAERLIQRECAACRRGGDACPSCGGDDEDEHGIQFKLRVGPPDDRFEEEADLVADQVMRMPDPRAGGSLTDPVPDPPAPLLRSGAHRSLRRSPEEDEDEDDELATTVRAKPSGSEAPDVSPETGAYVRSLGSGGRPLPDTARGNLEARLGYGFEGVRVHTDAAARRSAGELGARAYTVGHDVVFASGQYDPHSREGRHLLAHELTHVVQQGAATPLDRGATGGPARTAETSPAILQRQSPTSGPVVRRSPGDLVVGDAYVIRTPEGGNLMLRVQPTDESMLHGAEACRGAESCPNTVGNVKSETPALVKESRSYGWYVVETTTLEHGTRVGFVHERYLKPAAPSIPEGAYDEEQGVCVYEGVCEAPPAGDQAAEAPDRPIPEEKEGTPVYGLGEAALEELEPGTKVEQFGVIETQDGANLWPEMGRSKPKLGLLPTNTKVFYDRKMPHGWASVYVDGHQRGESLPVSAGTHGFLEAERVTTDMPDPDAWLYRITKAGQGALELAADLYPHYEADCTLGVAACRDNRYLVNVLVAVNEAKNRRFLYKEHPDDDWDEAKTKRATKTGSGYSGGQIWVPGMQLVKALEGQISSGSISLEALTTLADVAIGIAAFVVGLLHGALMSVADIFIGIYDLIKLAGKIVIKLIKGTLISDAKAFWEEISKIKISDVMEALSAKWNHPNTWDRWKFRGYVIGYAIVEILLLVFSGGIVTAVKWAGKAGKFGKFAKYLAKLPRVKKVIEAGKALKGKGVAKLKSAMKAAKGLSEAHSWAAKALRLPLGILRRLTKADIGKLKKLPQWARERFAALANKVKLRLLGCRSPCKVDVDAIQKALKLAGKGGKKLTSVDDVLGALKSLNNKLKTAKISRKLRKTDSALMKAIKEAELTDVDFKKMADFLTRGDLENPARAYRTFVRYLTSVVPAKTGPDIAKLNKIAAGMVKAEARRGAALKGAMFEQWVALHVPALASRTFGRVTFDLKKLIGKAAPPYRRHVDKWVPDKGEIWDMKHQFSKVPTGQVDDYAALVGKVAPDGNTVKSVNYLFPSKPAAKLNEHLAKTYKFGVYYIDEATNTMMKLY